MKKIVGLTGGIASGKSFVVGYLKKIKIPVYDFNDIIRLIYKKPTTIFINYLKKEGFRKTILKKTINKNIIRNDIFNHKDKRKKLEKFLHNELKKIRKIIIKKNKKQKIIF